MGFELLIILVLFFCDFQNKASISILKVKDLQWRRRKKGRPKTTFTLLSLMICWAYFLWAGSGQQQSSGKSWVTRLAIFLKTRKERKTISLVRTKLLWQEKLSKSHDWLLDNSYFLVILSLAILVKRILIKNLVWKTEISDEHFPPTSIAS